MFSEWEQKLIKRLVFQILKLLIMQQQHENRFLDIFLDLNAYFWISTGSGIDNLSKIFKKPILYVNQVPIGHITTFQKTAVIIFKHFFNSKIIKPIKS